MGHRGFILLAVLVTLSGCAMDSSFVPPPGPQTSSVKEVHYLKIIRDHVRKTRGWPDGSYSVYFRGREADGYLFAIINHEVADQMQPGAYGGDGKSFYAVVDPATDKVVSDGIMQ